MKRFYLAAIVFLVAAAVPTAQAFLSANTATISAQTVTATTGTFGQVAASGVTSNTGSFGAVAISGLTATYVPFAGTNGLLGGDSVFTYRTNVWGGTHTNHCLHLGGTGNCPTDAHTLVLEDGGAFGLAQIQLYGNASAIEWYNNGGHVWDARTDTLGWYLTDGSSGGNPIVIKNSPLTNAITVSTTGTSFSGVTANQVVIAASGTAELTGISPGAQGTVLGSSGGQFAILAPVVSPFDTQNVGFSVTKASNALTVNFTQSDASSNCSAVQPCNVSFRSATAATGGFNQRSITGALTVVAPSGASLGQAAAVSNYTYIYAQDNAGTVQGCLSTSNFDEGSVQTSTAISTSSTSSTVLYCTAAITGGVRKLGRFASSQTVAGQWGTAPTELSVLPLSAVAPYAKYVQKTGETMSSGVDLRINFETAIEDRFSLCTTGTGAFKCTANRSGLWYVNASLWTAANNGLGDATLYVRKNVGATNVAAIRESRMAVVSTVFALDLPRTLRLNNGDYLYSVINETTGGYNTDTDSTGSESVFEFYWIGD